MSTVHERSAAELWAWLLACLDCGQAHEWRPPGRGGTWAAADGHAYRMRARNAEGVRALRAQWDAS
jgi:hypothetical protein